MVRKWGEQIIRSKNYAAGLALVFAFVSFFNMPLGWLSTVIIALVTLQSGPRQGFFVMAWAILPAVAMLCLGQYFIFINIFVLHYLVVWILATFLRQTGSWANTIQIASLIGIITVVALYYLTPDLQNWLVNELTLIAKEYKSISLFNKHTPDIDIWLKYISLLAMGLLGLAIILTNMMILFLSRWWQSFISTTINLQKESYVIRVHYLSSLVLLFLVASLYINSHVLMNVLLLAFIPFVIAGLSLLHAYSATKKNGSTMLFIFYILFLFLSPYFVMLLSFLGWMDSFINLRKRFVIDRVVTEK